LYLKQWKLLGLGNSEGLLQISGVDGSSGTVVDFALRFGGPKILRAIAEKLKRRSKDDFKGRPFRASLIVQAVAWYLPLSAELS
jgi:hypothetical protein